MWLSSPTTKAVPSGSNPWWHRECSLLRSRWRGTLASLWPRADPHLWRALTSVKRSQSRCGGIFCPHREAIEVKFVCGSVLSGSSRSVHDLAGCSSRCHSRVSVTLHWPAVQCSPSCEVDGRRLNSARGFALESFPHLFANSPRHSPSPGSRSFLNALG